MATNPVPHLTTAMSGPLNQVETLILENQSRIESWFREQWRRYQVPFYASVDIRHAGFKLAPVDTNLFPAGFNNLNPLFQPLCIQAVQLAIERIGKKIDSIMIVPESHTRNIFYLENLAALREIIDKAGFDVKTGSLIADIREAMTISLPSGQQVVLEPVTREGNKIVIGDFSPDMILLNNDLSSGQPEILESLDQYLTPGLNMGWTHRLKSKHFDHYRNIVHDFADQFKFDPWLIDPMFRNCGEVDFMKREGENCLSRNVEALLKEIQKKYDEYGIKCDPFVMLKADSGTYGMGVMTVKSPEEIAELNRKQRTRMATVKEGLKVSKAIIQEGVYTYETWGKEEKVAEPVVYMIGHSVVGGFYRVHDSKAVDESLNAPGMRFEPLAFDDCCISPEPEMAPDAHPNRFYVFGVISRLAILAAAREMSE